MFPGLHTSAARQFVWACREWPYRRALRASSGAGDGAYPPAPRVRFFPAFRDEAVFLDTYWKAMFFMPAGTVSQLVFPIAFRPSFPIDEPAAFPVPPHLSPPSPGVRREVSITRERASSLPAAIRRADVVAVWDWSAVPPGGVAADSPRLLNLDRERNRADAWTWCEFLYRQSPAAERAGAIASSRARIADFLARQPSHRRAYVFGTGPSLEQAWQYDFSDGYRIVCNTIVNNAKLLDKIRPHLIVAGDAAYHFDVNLHAAAFRRDLERALASRDMLFITRDLYGPLMRVHHPNTRAKTALAETGVPGIHFNIAERMVYHQWPHGNILNALLLPLGSALADEVFLLGFDGRAPGETAFWQNATSSTYDALKPAIKAAHPGFFGIDFGAYAQAHSDNAEQLMRAGEAMGKRYVCLNDSYIPAFRKRRGAL